MDVRSVAYVRYLISGIHKQYIEHKLHDPHELRIQNENIKLNYKSKNIIKEKRKIIMNLNVSLSRCLYAF